MLSKEFGRGTPCFVTLTGGAQRQNARGSALGQHLHVGRVVLLEPLQRRINLTLFEQSLHLAE